MKYDQFSYTISIVLKRCINRMKMMVKQFNYHAIISSCARISECKRMNIEIGHPKISTMRHEQKALYKICSALTQILCRYAHLHAANMFSNLFILISMMKISLLFL